jgi:hypothetical protein
VKPDIVYHSSLYIILEKAKLSHDERKSIRDWVVWWRLNEKGMRDPFGKIKNIVYPDLGGVTRMYIFVKSLEPKDYFI